MRKIMLMSVLALTACNNAGEAEEPEAIEEAEMEAEAQPSELAPRGAQQVMLEERVSVDEAPAELWARIGDQACDLKDWLPGVESCEVTSGTDGQVGAIRLLNGGPVQEEFIAWDNAGRTHSYKMIEGPFAEAGYTATLSVVPGDNGGSEAVWKIEATPTADQVETMTQAFQGMLNAGLSKISGKPMPEAPATPDTPAPTE